jgi:histidyl-tRNA synthetase
MKPGAIKGFPEWLPEEEQVQQNLIDAIRRSFELHGFGPIHTRAVEPMETLLSKGETDKEIYTLRRYQGDPDDGGSLGLHYDLTVPLARYVTEHHGRLVFPFRRHQIQSAWRGERPQLGRYREFIQADADIVGEGSLPARYDAEMVALLARTLDTLPVPPVRVQVNNRKILQGFYLGLGVQDVTGALRCIDKLAKIGVDGVLAGLQAAGLTAAQAGACVALAQLGDDLQDLESVRALGVSHPLLEEGLAELAETLRYCRQQRLRTEVVAALHVARGFDYYTGTVVEGVLRDNPNLGSVCSGGRYENLASAGRTKLPGMGISIGISRIMGFLAHLGVLKPERRSPAEVLVAVHNEDTRHISDEIARDLRARDIACLVSDTSAPYSKQIKVAVRLGIRHVWFPGMDGKSSEVRDLDAGTQASADPATWDPGTSTKATSWD